MKIAVLGAGAMGQVTVRDLVESKAVQEVLIIDLDLKRAEELKSRLKSPKLRAISGNIKEPAALESELANYSVLINASPYVFNLDVMALALRTKCHYLDLGGLFHTTRKQLELSSEFAAADLSAVLGMGAAPGITNVMAACAVDGLDRVHSIDISAASVDQSQSSHPFLPPYALDTILDEYFLEPVVFEDGEFRSVPPLSGEELAQYPQPVGKASAFLTLHSEVATLPLSYKEKGLRNCTYRLGLPTEFHERCKFLVDLGFADNEPVEFSGHVLKPRQILAKMISRIAVADTEIADCEVIRVDARGSLDGRSVHVRLETTVFSHPKWSVSAGALDTGVPPSIVAQMLASGSIKMRGVLAPEIAVPYRPFFDELSLRGITMRRQTEEELSCRDGAASAELQMKNVCR